MKYFTLLLFALFSLAHTEVLKIDRVYLLENIALNPEEIDSRLILAKSYFQEHDYDNALIHIEKVLEVDSQHELARKLESDILKLQKLASLFKNNGIENFQETKKIEMFLYNLYQDGKYQEYIDIYHVLENYNIKTSENIDIYFASSYFKLGNYHLAEEIVARLKVDKQSKDLLYLKFELYEKKQDLSNASKFYKKIQEGFPKSNGLKEITKRLSTLQKKNLNVLALAYEKNPTFEILQPYVYTLYDLKKQEEAIAQVENFTKSNSKPNSAKILLSDLYYWRGNLKKSITILAPLVKNSKDSDLLKRYAIRLYENGKYKSALKYLPTLVKSTVDPDEKNMLKTKLAYAYYYSGKKKRAQKLFLSLVKEHAGTKDMQKILDQIKADSRLALALKRHKQKKYQKALYHYKAYFKVTNDPEIAKEIGEIYYFQMNSYKESLPFYKFYLQKVPKDSTILFHYASAYEKLEQYRKAAKIFKKIVKQKDDLYYLSKYHYGSSLKNMRKDKAWLKSQEVLLSLLEELYMGEQTSQNSDLIKYTKLALLEVQKPMPKPVMYGDIILGEGQKKILAPQDVFSIVNIKTIASPSLQSMFHNKNQQNRPNISLLFDYVNDNNLYHRTYGVKIDDMLSVKDIYFGFSTKKFYFNSNRQKQEAEGYYLQAHKRDLYLSLGLVEFQDFTHVEPSIGYSTTLQNHQLDFLLKYTNGVFVNHRLCMVQNQTKVLQLNIYDKIILKNLDESDFNLEINAYDNDNVNIAASISYPLYHQQFYDYEHTIDFSGFYEYNSKQNLCYTAAAFYDNSYLRIKPRLLLNSYGFLEVILGIGYSFENREVLATYGLNASIPLSQDIDLELYCNRSQNSYSQDGYNTCAANIIHTW